MKTEQRYIPDILTQISCPSTRKEYQVKQSLYAYDHQVLPSPMLAAVCTSPLLIL